METEIQTLERLYDRFNARDIDAVLASLAEDVAWANAMEGGHVHGHEGVRDCWTRQWAIVSPTVQPVGFDRTADGEVVVEVRQTVCDLDGNLLAGQSHGLKDKTVLHVFRFRDCKVVRFDVRDAAS